MRFLLAVLALAGALTAARADDRFPVGTLGGAAIAAMSADDVTRAVRCAPPRVCRVPPRRKPPAVVTGGSAVASFYAHAHHGRRTASGERFDMHAATCAHKNAPFGAVFRVTYRGRSATCRVNDRGPYVDGRALDVSLGVARAIGMVGAGVGRVSIERIN